MSRQVKTKSDFVPATKKQQRRNVRRRLKKMEKEFDDISFEIDDLQNHLNDLHERIKRHCNRNKNLLLKESIERWLEDVDMGHTI